VEITSWARSAKILSEGKILDHLIGKKRGIQNTIWGDLKT
jgi:hypothetical protein